MKLTYFYFYVLHVFTNKAPLNVKIPIYTFNLQTSQKKEKQEGLSIRVKNINLLLNQVVLQVINISFKIISTHSKQVKI